MITDLKQRMDGAVHVLEKEFSGLRTGRASPDILAPVMVEAYGSLTPLNQVGNISVPDARMLSLQVWDRSLVSVVEKAIREAGLGLNPSSDGDTVRVTFPELTEERRKELVKVAGKYAEAAKVSVRNVRRDGMEDVKKQQKDGAISEDDARRIETQIQKLTDDTVAKIDVLLQQKEKDVMKV